MENSKIAFDDAGHSAMHYKNIDDEEKKMEKIATLTKAAWANFHAA